MALTVTATREEMTRSQLEGEIEIMSVCEWRCCIVVGEERTATCKERVLGKILTLRAWVDVGEIHGGSYIP